MHTTSELLERLFYGTDEIAVDNRIAEELQDRQSQASRGLTLRNLKCQAKDLIALRPSSIPTNVRAEVVAGEWSQVRIVGVSQRIAETTLRWS
jgi:hypothetical protein